jgi:hypothetical protein
MHLAFSIKSSIHKKKLPTRILHFSIFQSPFTDVVDPDIHSLENKLQVLETSQYRSITPEFTLSSDVRSHGCKNQNQNHEEVSI